MTQHSKYIYVFYCNRTGHVFCGLMDAPDREHVKSQILQLNPDALAIRVNDANDTRPAEPVYGSDYNSAEVKTYIYCFMDSETGGLTSGLRREPCFHPELRRESIQHYYPGAQGIIIDEVSEEEIPALCNCKLDLKHRSKQLFRKRIGKGLNGFLRNVILPAITGGIIGSAISLLVAFILGVRW